MVVEAVIGNSMQGFREAKHPIPVGFTTWN